MRNLQKRRTSAQDDGPDLLKRHSPAKPPRRLGLLVFLLTALALSYHSTAPVSAQANPAPSAGTADAFKELRHDMVEVQIRRRGIETAPLLDAMGEVPRHLFVPESARDQAYRDTPVRFAPGQTLLQANVSAQMIELLEIESGDKVLEVGTGSGYDAAVLSRLAAEVYTIEIDAVLAQRAERLLAQLGYDNVEVRTGDGYRGWPEKGPFDAILITAAPHKIPEPLFEQLKLGGRMVVAVGARVQDLQVITRTKNGRQVRMIRPVVLGPMTGEVRED